MKRTRMAGSVDFNLKKLLMLLACIALIVGLVFHLIYLFSDSSEDSPQDLYNRENAKMFLLLAVALGIVSMLLPEMTQ